MSCFPILCFTLFYSTYETETTFHPYRTHNGTNNAEIGEAYIYANKLKIQLPTSSKVSHPGSSSTIGSDGDGGSVHTCRKRRQNCKQFFGKNLISSKKLRFVVRFLNINVQVAQIFGQKFHASAMSRFLSKNMLKHIGNISVQNFRNFCNPKFTFLATNYGL